MFFPKVMANGCYYFFFKCGKKKRKNHDMFETYYFYIETCFLKKTETK